MKEIKVVLEDCVKENTYFAGDTLKGVVELNFSKNQKINGIYVIVYGRAKTFWSANKSLHQGEQIYLDGKYYLAGSKSSSDFELSAGEHQFNFSVKIPENCPASYKIDKQNFINYYVEAVLDLPWSLNKKSKLDFKVERCDDLNDIPQLRIPCEQEKSRESNCFNCASGILTSTVCIPQSGYIPGSSILVSIHLENKTTKKISKVETKLVQNIICTSYKQGKANFSELPKINIIAVAVDEGVEISETKSFQRTIQIPDDLMNTNTLYCRVIQIYYILKVKAGRCKAEFPIVIGSVPLNREENGNFDTNIPSAYFGEGRSSAEDENLNTCPSVSGKSENIKLLEKNSA